MHSVQEYIERMSTCKLEEFLSQCQDCGREESYEYIIPFVKTVLQRRKEAEKIPVPGLGETEPS